ncbi:hypothetical protein [Emticicia fontis]
MFSFICTQFVTEGIRIHELTANKTEQCLDISLEDSGSLEAKLFSLDEAEECFSAGLFKPVVIECTLNKEAMFFTSYVPEVYLGLNTPPPEQMRLLA